LNGDGHRSYGWTTDKASGASSSVRSKFLKYCVICLLTVKFDEELNGDGLMTHG